MALLADVCRFNPTLGGTTDWIFSSAVTGYQSPAAAGLVNLKPYSVRAESSNLAQWELSVGLYNSSTGTFSRTRVIANSSGTTAKINFSAAPQVAVVALAEDLATAANMRGHLGGFGTAWTSTTTLTINPGGATDAFNEEFINLPAALVKSTSAWAAGTAVGGLDTGSIAANAWYFFFAIKNLTTGAVDVVFSLGAAAPTTLPSGFTYYRRVGSARTNGSSQWTKFIQDGDLFMWDVPVKDVQASNPGTAAVTRTLSTPVGIRTQALCTVILDATTGTNDNMISCYLSDLSVADTAAGLAGAPSIEGFFAGYTFGEIAQGGFAQVMTNTSSQVRSRVQLSPSAGANLYIFTNGWRDTRGKDA